MWAREETIRPVKKAAVMVVLAATAAALLSAGCDKAMECYKQGEDLLVQNQYDQAVAKFESAYHQCRQKRNRDCSMFEERLSYARHLAAEQYYNRAQTDLIAARLDDAARHIARAVEYEPANMIYLNMRQRILDEIAAVEALRRQARDYAAQRQWDAAIEAMEQAMALNRTLSGAQAELDRIKRDAYNFYLAAARALFEAGQWDEAAAQAGRALQYYAGSEARDIIAEIGNRREALELIEQAKLLRDGGADPQAVLDVLEKARRLYPSHPEIAVLILQAKQAVCDAKIASAVQAMDAGQLHEALRLLSESTRLLKDYGGAADLMAVVSESIARRHVDLGDSFRQQGHYGNAALHYITAMNYRSDFAPARAGLAASLGLLRDSVRYSIGYVGFSSAWQDRQVAESIETGLLQHINRTRPANIVIKDLLGFKTVLANINTSIVDINVADVRIENSWPKDADALMMGQVITRDVTVTEAFTHGRSKYQSGTHMEPNPEYLKTKTRVDSLLGDHVIVLAELAAVRVKAEKMTQRRPEDTDDDIRYRRREADKMIAAADKKAAGLQRELAKARQHLAQTPPHLAIPIISEHEYPIRHITQRARVVAFLKLVDAKTGAVLVAEKIEGVHAAEDSYVMPDLAHNVPGDPLELPDENFLVKKATEQIMGKLFGLCYSYLQNHSKRFVAMMNQANSDGNPETAVEYAMRYLISPSNGGQDRNQAIAFLRAIIAQRNENSTPDLNGLFARYYKP